MIDPELLAQLDRADHVWIDTYSEMIRTGETSFHVGDTHAILRALLLCGWVIVNSGFGQVITLEKKADRSTDSLGDVMSSSPKYVIEQAMKSSTPVWMRYRSSSGSIREHIIVPKIWESQWRFVASSDLSNSDLRFNVNSVIECEPIEPDSIEDRASETKHASASVVSARKLLGTVGNQSATTDGKAVVKPFSQVHDGEEWARLVRYYRQCLIVENRQQYIVKQDELLVLDVTRADVQRFMSGADVLQFDLTKKRRSDPAVRFLRSEEDNGLKQLCVGYPLLVLGDGKIAPLLYCQATRQQTETIVTLSPEPLEISYAALSHFGFSDEEINQFLVEYAKLRSDSELLPPQALEQAIIAKFSDVLGVELAISDDFHPFTLLSSPAMFWVDQNVATAALIEELQVLANPSMWTFAPESLKALLSICPQHEYPEVPPFREDPVTYVTLVNESQRRAAAAASTEAVTVVTGPPGTGKSQLVLNLIANAFLNHQSVLFASRNNQAVDVVMGRLQQEIRFPGAVRTGNRKNREQATLKVEAALDAVSTVGATSQIAKTREKYQQARQDAIRSRDDLEELKELTGLLESRRAERDNRLRALPKAVAKLAPDTIPVYDPGEIELLQAELAALHDTLIPLKARRHDLAGQANSLLTQNRLDDPCIGLLTRFGDQWGTFGDGLVKQQSFESIPDLLAFARRWSEVLPALGQLSAWHATRASYQRWTDTLRTYTDAVPARLHPSIRTLAETRSPDELMHLNAQMEHLGTRARQIADDRLSIWDRILMLLQVRDPLQQALSSYDPIARSLGLDANVMVEDVSDPAMLAQACDSLAELLVAAATYHSAEEARSANETARERYDKARECLPETLQSELSLLPAMEQPAPALTDALASLVDEIQRLQEEADAGARRVNSLLDENVNHLRMLDEFKATRAGASHRLWSVDVPARLIAVEGQIRKWLNLLVYWTESAAVKRIEEGLAQLPNETQAIVNVKATGDRLLQLGGQVLQDTWFGTAAQATNAQIQGARDYVSSPRPSTFTSAQVLFPVWATTNLSTKTNFPLQPGLFDLVIIDEASQCDIPSALPLLYRAKRAVIIGDPNQLRHIATISESTDVDEAAKAGVGKGAFLYSERSLFDLAQRSVGNRPGNLLLNEHYRSDSRIISFSNHVFYRDSLLIRTDLTQNGFSRQFLNNYGGIYWLHVEGQTLRPRSGSAVNRSELAALRFVLPRLAESLTAHGEKSRSIGIVTPYRAQKDEIGDWLKTSAELTDLAQVGTAHTYQGDERDFMILSPVLAHGISERSLSWLARTENLLNVAVTRARVGLIVIGDWDFCHSLADNNPYRLLANYVIESDNRLYRSQADVPLLGGPVVELSGYVIDPHNPEHSRTTLRRFLATCRDYVWWLDNYFNDKTIELFREVFENPQTSLRQVHLLTAVEQFDGGNKGNSFLKAQLVQDLKRDLADRGVDFDVRVLPKKDIGVHDRLLFYPGRAINMPPFMGAIGIHKHVTEYTPSNITPSLFEELWDRAEVVGSGPHEKSIL
ncbi:MAG: DUF2075 domain-containing protein [Anaerolineae bacterium]|nr:DUF2075 domain-containing protein [Anaerolineae bacterium]